MNGFPRILAWQEPATRLSTRLAWLSRIFGDTARKAALALVAQAIVSGVNFLTTVMIGRCCGLEDLGIYSLSFTVLVALTVLQDALIGAPFTVYSQRLSDAERNAYVGNLLVLQSLLTLAAMGCLLTIAALVPQVGGPPGLSTSLSVVAWATPFCLLRLFIRRLLLTRLMLAPVVLLDLSVATLQIAGFAALVRTGAFSAATALVSVGLACALPCLVWLAYACRKLTASWQSLSGDLRRHWAFGRWLCGSQLTELTQRYAIHWLLAGFVGATTTGVYAACTSVVLLINPVILGIGSIVSPKAAQAYQAGGRRALRRVVRNATVLVSALLLVFYAALLGWGDAVVRYLYRGPDMGDHQSLIALLALTVLANTTGFVADQGLCVMERPDLNFKVGTLGLAVTAAIASSSVNGWGVEGAALGGLMGHLVVSTIKGFAFLRLTRERTPGGAVV